MREDLLEIRITEIMIQNEKFKAFAKFIQAIYIDEKQEKASILYELDVIKEAVIAQEARKVPRMISDTSRCLVSQAEHKHVIKQL